MDSKSSNTDSEEGLRTVHLDGYRAHRAHVLGVEVISIAKVNDGQVVQVVEVAKCTDIAEAAAVEAFVASVAGLASVSHALAVRISRAAAKAIITAWPSEPAPGVELLAYTAEVERRHVWRLPDERYMTIVEDDHSIVRTADEQAEYLRRRDAEDDESSPPTWDELRELAESDEEDVQ